MLQRSSLWFPARLLLQPTDCCRYAVNFNKENKRMNQFLFCQTVVVWLDRMSLCALLSTRSRWVTGVNKTKKNTGRVFQRRVMEVFFFFPWTSTTWTDSTAAVMSRRPPALRWTSDPVLINTSAVLPCPLLVEDLVVIVCEKLANRWY